MTREQRVEAFIRLGNKIKELIDTEEMALLAQQAKHHNGWFTQKHIRIAFQGAITLLEETSLKKWVGSYEEPQKTQAIGVVMAGNIPMAGLHDMISVLISGHTLLAKLSSQDSILLRQVAKWLVDIEPAFSSKIEFVERLKEMDAVIATGSDNTSRYFEYYFKKVPNIIRKNRVSVAVLNGEETPEEIDALANDMLLHYGLGCRNVSKLWLPKNYDPTTLLGRWNEAMEEAKMHHKYMNNYDYNRAIYLVNRVDHYDGGGLMMKEDEQLVSPVSVIFYEFYDNLESLQSKLHLLEEKIQCVVSKEGVLENTVPYGQAQFPTINDYADNVDTMAFLAHLS